MTRVTTPTHFFRSPIPVEDLKDVLLTYQQNGDIVLEKHLEDMTAEGCLFHVKLTQEETKRFEKGMVSIQIRLLTVADDAIASEEAMFSVKDVINDVVMQ